MMKKSISLFLAALIFLNLISFTHSSSAHAATPSPSVITNANDLLSIGSSGDYILSNDIDMTGIYWETMDFGGTLDGNGNTISNLSTSYGLFAYADGATIENLTLENITVDGEYSWFPYAGTLVNCATGLTVTNCHVSGYINHPAYYVGGLVGYMEGSMTGCTSMVEVGDGNWSGGLVGYLYGDITDCSAITNVTGWNAGGLVGQMEGSMTRCGARVDVYGSNLGGGLVGELNGDVIDCYVIANVTGTCAGGLVGHISGSGMFARTYAAGTSAYAELVGDADAYSDIAFTDCFSLVAADYSYITGISYIYGFLEFTRCYSLEASVTPYATDSYYCHWNVKQSEAAYKQQSAYTDWDFNEVWSIIPGETYPFLQGSPSPFSILCEYGHTPGSPATCTQAQVCTDCSITLQSPFGHTPGWAANCTMAQKCTHCGEVLAAALGHDGDPCSDCGYTFDHPVFEIPLEAESDELPPAAIEVLMPGVYLTSDELLTSYWRQESSDCMGVTNMPPTSFIEALVTVINARYDLDIAVEDVDEYSDALGSLYCVFLDGKTIVYEYYNNGEFKKHFTVRGETSYCAVNDGNNVITTIDVEAVIVEENLTESEAREFEEDILAGLVPYMDFYSIEDVRAYLFLKNNQEIFSGGMSAFAQNFETNKPQIIYLGGSIENHEEYGSWVGVYDPFVYDIAIVGSQQYTKNPNDVIPVAQYVSQLYHYEGNRKYNYFEKGMAVLDVLAYGADILGVATGVFGLVLSTHGVISSTHLLLDITVVGEGQARFRRLSDFTTIDNTYGACDAVEVIITSEGEWITVSITFDNKYTPNKVEIISTEIAWKLDTQHFLPNPQEIAERYVLGLYFHGGTWPWSPNDPNGLGDGIRYLPERPTITNHSLTMASQITPSLHSLECETCGYEISGSHNFVWQYTASTHSQQCVCGLVKANTTGSHSWTCNDMYNKNSKEVVSCSCGYPGTRNHILEVHYRDGGLNPCSSSTLCQSGGYRYYTCANANCILESTGEVFQAGQHDYVYGVCTLCNYTNTHNHNFGSWSNYSSSQHRRACSCGEYEYGSHNHWGYHYDSSQHWRTCTSCGHTYDYGNHSLTYYQPHENKTYCDSFCGFYSMGAR